MVGHDKGVRFKTQNADSTTVGQAYDVKRMGCMKT